MTTTEPASQTHLDIKRFVADFFHVDVSSITEGMAPNDIPGWDSQRDVELIIALEDRYAIAFSATDLSLSMESVGTLIRLVSAKIDACREGF